MKEVSYNLMREERQIEQIKNIKESLESGSAEVSISARDYTGTLIIEPFESFRSFMKRAAISDNVKGLHIGSPLGIILSESALNSSLNYIDGLLYSLKFDFLYKDVCILDYLDGILTMCYSDSCGRCVLCREGIRQMQKMLRAMTTGTSRQEDVAILRDVAQGIADGSYCEFGMGVGILVLSALDSFSEEFENHAFRKRCDAAVCRKYVTFHILGNCTGCGECVDTCEEGEIGRAHV